MDVKYIPSDWDKMKDGIGDLIGLGRWGKGMIDELKDLSDNLEDAESDIANYDSDGVISFHHASQKNIYQGLFEDFKVLHSFTGKVGDIVDRTIDQPFYEDMDAFVEAMRDLTISNYTTKNRMGVTETQFVYAGYGPAQSFEVPKTEVSLDDLFNGDNFYAGQMKQEYEAWQELNPEKDFSQEEYQQAALNTHAFEYESIRNQQENKEFWVQIGALVVIVGVALICPPAGLALGAAYGAMELSSAVSGKDWVSGRKLGTQERWVRGLLAPLDIVPGVSGLTKFSSTVRLANLGENMGQLGVRAGMKGSLQSGMTHVDQLVKTAGQQSAARLRSAASAINDGANIVKNKLARDTFDAARLADTVITKGKDFMPGRVMIMTDDMGNTVKIRKPAENTHATENWVRDVLSRIDGVNIGSGSKAEKSNKEISEADRAKLNGWMYPPKDEMYLEYKDVYDNPIYFEQETGRTLYPGTDGDPNIDGFLNGEYDKQTLTKGTIIDRFGDNGTGRFFSPDGSDFESRALPPFMKDKPYERYTILREFECKSGKIAPWFDQEGYGIQFFTDYKIKDLKGNWVEATVDNLKQNKYISPLK